MINVRDRIKAKLEQERLAAESERSAQQAQEEEAVRRLTSYAKFFAEVALPSAQSAADFLRDQGLKATIKLVQKGRTSIVGSQYPELEMTVGRSMSYVLRVDHSGGLELVPFMHQKNERVFIGKPIRSIKLGSTDGTTVDEFCDVLLDAWDRLGYR